jgi:hypothetical protein
MGVRLLRLDAYRPARERCLAARALAAHQPLLTPLWAIPRPYSSNPYSFPPKSPELFASFMRQLVLRYGPNGSFWTLNPDVPRGSHSPVANLERANGAVDVGPPIGWSDHAQSLLALEKAQCVPLKAVDVRVELA